MLPTLRHTTATRPHTTAHLAQTMTLLELSAAELHQKIEAELARNPALELKEEKRCPFCHRLLIDGSACPRCNLPKNHNPEEPIVFISPREDFVPGPRARESSGDYLEDNLAAATENLPTYVLRQIAPELAVQDRLLAAHLLNGMDEDGLLATPQVEIARILHLPLSRVEAVTRLIQHADPVGIGSPTPQAALLVQLERLEESGLSPTLAKQAARAIELGWDQLSHRQYPELGRLIGVSTRRARQIADYIAHNLNPRPARASWGDIRSGREAAPPVYTYPDVVIAPANRNPQAPLVVEIITPYAGQLQVSQELRQALSQAPEEKASEWRSDLERADLLVKCLQQRTHTFVRLMQRISSLQREFILHGDSCLQPVTRASLAKELEVHESTVSRAVTGKCVQLPNGHIIPLAKFFDRSLHIRAVIKRLIEAEARSLSDSEIVALLAEQGYKIARRTVAKYRSMEGILPSHLRPHLRAGGNGNGNGHTVHSGILESSP